MNYRARPDSRQSIIQVVGFNPDSGMGGPWRLAEGSVRDLKIPDGVIIDRIYQGKLGVASIGDVVEIAGHRARVVAFSEGIRSFTTEPFVFTSAENAHDFGSIADDRVQFLLVKIAPGVDVKTVRQNIAERVRGVSVYTTSEFGRMTRHYWTFTTGAGIAILLAAVLGLVVGFVVVAQTIYATTVHHIKEFGTLKAMGAPNRLRVQSDPDSGRNRGDSWLRHGPAGQPGRCALRPAGRRSHPHQWGNSI